MSKFDLNEVGGRSGGPAAEVPAELARAQFNRKQCNDLIGLDGGENRQSADTVMTAWQRRQPVTVAPAGDGHTASFRTRANSAGGTSGCNCSIVHCCGALSGRQRRNLVPCRNLSPVTWS